jgi:hypothetical protein
MPYHNPMPDYFDNLLSAARAVALTEIDAAPAKVAQLRAVLDSVNTQINLVRRSLISEKSEFDAWRRHSVDEDDFEQTQRQLDRQDLATQLSETRAELVRIQNETFAAQREFDRIAKEHRQLERQLMFPHAVPVG